MDYISILSKNRTYIMGIAMISIMLFHQTWIKSLPFLAFRAYGNFGVDIFFFVSGFGLVYSLQKYSTLEFYKRRLIRLLPLCIFCGISKYLLTTFVSIFAETTEVSWLTIFGFDLWFIDVLLVFYLITPFLYKNIIKYGWEILIFSIILAIIVSYFKNLETNFWILRWGVVRLPVFILGIIIAQKKFIPGNTFLFLGIFFVLLAICYGLIIRVNALPMPGLLTAVILFLGIPSLCFYLIKSVPIIRKLHLFNPIEFTGKHSLELFLWHPYIYEYIDNVYLSPIPKFIIAVLISYILAYCSNLAISYLKKINISSLTNK